MTKEKLFGKTLTDLQAVVVELGLQKFVAKQLCEWLYQKEISSFDEMTNLSIKVRNLLNEKFEVGIEPPVKVQESIDGTKKYLFAAKDGKFIETAMIPDDDRKTVCVSTQIGCKMGCLFCMTAKQGFQGQLTAGEIVNQFRSIAEWHNLTNIVYMGMGEPLDNLENLLKSIEILTSSWGFALSPKRITVSSIGLIPALETFANSNECHIAISLHTPFDSERKELMPIQMVYPIEKVIEKLKTFDFNKQRRISFEYIMFKGVNDTPRHVKELARLLNGIKCRINLISFHPIPGTPLLGSDDQTIQQFKELLNNKGITTTIRASRGQDIYAACGLLSTKNIETKTE